MDKDIEIAPDLGAQMFEDETAEEAVARIVAQNPQKHGVTLEQRKALAIAALVRVATSGIDVSNLSAEDALIVSVGGDPNEMMVGNKPRYTVDEAGNVKDHETGEVHIQAPPGMESVGAGVEEVPAGQTVVESGPLQDAEGGDSVGIEQDQADRGQAQSIGSPATEPVATEKDDGGAEGIESAGVAYVDGDSGDAAGGTTFTVTVNDGEKITGGVLGSDGKVYSLQEWEALQQAQHPDRNQSDDQAAEKSAYLEARVELTIEMLRAIRAICAHSWPEDPQESTPCAKCGMTFEDWANL